MILARSGLEGRVGPCRHHRTVCKYAQGSKAEPEQDTNAGIEKIHNAGFTPPTALYIQWRKLCIRSGSATALVAGALPLSIHATAVAG